MKLLAFLISLISLAWLWLVYQIVVTPLDTFVFVISIIVFSVMWFIVIWSDYSGNRDLDKWIRPFGYFIFSFAFASILFRLIKINLYENLAFLIFATSFFGLFIYVGYRLFRDKVFD